MKNLSPKAKKMWHDNILVYVTEGGGVPELGHILEFNKEVNACAKQLDPKDRANFEILCAETFKIAQKISDLNKQIEQLIVVATEL